MKVPCRFFYCMLISVIWIWHSSPSIQAITLVNGNFETDGGLFLIPTGWTPFGEGSFEGTWDQNWKAQVVNLYPLHQAGFYQVVPDVTPGTRYRLTAQAKSGNNQLNVRIGLLSGLTAEPQDIIWSSDQNQNNWTSLSVEVTAQSAWMLIILQVRNINTQYQILAGGAWDEVNLVPIGTETAPTPSPAATPAIPPSNDVYANLANLWSLAWPKTGVHTLLSGTHDPNPDSNADYDRVEGTINDGGETWTVLKSYTGAGALLRIWMTNFQTKGLIRIYADGVRVVDEKIVDFFGTPGQFSSPLVNRTSGAWMSYLPIPYTQSARVQVRDAEQFRFYWQITSQTFDSAQGVRPFTNPLNSTDSAHYRNIRSQWLLAGLNPKSPWPGTQETSGVVSVAAGATTSFWSQTGAGKVDAFWIDVPASDETTLQGLRLLGSWDNETIPQVDVPLGIFFGVGYNKIITRSLLIGMMPPDGGYCYFPMPYRTGASLQLRNTTGSLIQNIRYKVRWVPLSGGPDSSLRFHAGEVRDSRAGEGRLYYPLDIQGRGHFAGFSGALAHGNVNDWHYLEGDEYFHVDGETNPSTAGTGTEDYFTCGWYFSAGAISLAPIGAPEVRSSPDKRVAVYRLHVPDWVPFNSSFRFGLEVGDSVTASEYGNYRTVCYYYLESPSANKSTHLQTR